MFYKGGHIWNFHYNRERPQKQNIVEIIFIYLYFFLYKTSPFFKIFSAVDYHQWATLGVEESGNFLRVELTSEIRKYENGLSKICLCQNTNSICSNNVWDVSTIGRKWTLALEATCAKKQIFRVSFETHIEWVKKTQKLCWIKWKTWNTGIKLGCFLSFTII